MGVYTARRYYKIRTWLFASESVRNAEAPRARKQTLSSIQSQRGIPIAQNTHDEVSAPHTRAEAALCAANVLRNGADSYSICKPAYYRLDAICLPY